MAALHHSSPIDSQCFITVPHSSQLCFSTQRVTSLFPSWHGSILLHSTGYFTVPQLTGLQHGSILLHSTGYFTVPQLTGLQHGSTLLHVMGYFTIPQLTGLQHGSILLHSTGYSTVPQLTGLQHGSILLHVMGYFTVPQLTGLQHGSILLHVMGYFTVPQLTGLQHGSRSTGSIVVPSRHGVFQKKWTVFKASAWQQLPSHLPTSWFTAIPGKVSKAEGFFFFFFFNIKEIPNKQHRLQVCEQIPTEKEAPPPPPPPEKHKSKWVEWTCYQVHSQSVTSHNEQAQSTVL